jgi:hypothetical protein
VAAITEVQGTVSGWLERIGIGWIAAAFAVISVIAAGTARMRAVSRARRERSPSGDGDAEVRESPRREDPMTAAPDRGRKRP